MRSKKTHSLADRAENVAGEVQNLPEKQDASEVAETTGVNRMEQGDQMNAVDRSQAEQNGPADEIGIAWVGMQWRMDGYCGRANAGGQQQCGTAGGNEPSPYPQMVQPHESENEPTSAPQPVSARLKPVRRGPTQQVA